MNPLAVAAVFGLALVFVIVAFLVIATYNDVVALERRIDKAWANIDVALKQRWDELPNLVEAVRDVMAFESRVLNEVTRLRAAYSPNAAVSRQAETSEATTAAVRQLLAVVERYPVLKSAGTYSPCRRRSNAWRASSPTGESCTTTRSTGSTPGSRRSRQRGWPDSLAGARGRSSPPLPARTRGPIRASPRADRSRAGAATPCHGPVMTTG